MLAERAGCLGGYPCAFVLMNSSVVRYASRSVALWQLNAWIEMRAPIPKESVAYRLIEDGLVAGEDGGVSQDVWFRDWPKGYDLTELARRYAAYNETFSLIWFEQNRGPAEPVKNYAGVPTETDDGGLKELDGVLSFSKKTKRS